MSKNRKLDVFVIMLFIVEILIVKHFYQTEDLFHFRSLFWGFHELVTLIFLGISYILLHEDIGYYDVFLILFPFIGISLLLLERIFQKWKVSNAVIDELLSSDEQEEKKEQKFVPEEFEIMSYYDLLSSDNIDEKKKFQDKLHKKVEWVSNNKNKILEEMSENDKQKYIFEIEDYIVCGVIVRKEYSNSIFNQNLKYSIVTSNKICEFIKNI